MKEASTGLAKAVPMCPFKVTSKKTVARFASLGLQDWVKRSMASITGRDVIAEKINTSFYIYQVYI